MTDPVLFAAFIPVRGGSKSIPLKNIKPIAGKPLVHWTIEAALDCPRIDRVFVCTDSEAIREACATFAQRPDFEIVGRSPEVSTDTASTESVMIEFLEQHPEIENIVLIQATSPLLQARELDTGIQRFREPGVDSVLSLVRQKRFIWKEEAGLVRPENYDYRQRPRRQEYDGQLIENGAFYVISRADFLRDQCRLTGNIAYLEMPEDTYFEIDEPEDFEIIEQMIRRRQQQDD